MTDLPVVCKLSGPELQQRREQVLERISAQVQEAQPLSSGWALRFEPEDATLELLLTAIQVERQCCPFLRFQLTLEAEGGALWLELSGPAGTRELVAAELHLSPPQPAEPIQSR